MININKKKLFVYARPNAMKGHRFSDNVAICYAGSKKEAIDIFFFFFSRPYADPEMDRNVFEPYFNYEGIAILTDY